MKLKSLIAAGFAAAVLVGCASPDTIAHVTLQSVAIEEWVKDDGKVYLCAMPTWKNEGPADALSVRAMVAPTDKGTPFEEPDKLIYSGDAIPAGGVFRPTRIPEDGMVLGEKGSLAGRVKSADDLELYLYGSDEPASEPPKDAP